MIKDQPYILVVDDELFFRKLYSDLLTDEGYRVKVCENGEEAIALLQGEPVDLVLTDMVMPGKCGLEVLRVARTLTDPPDVVLATGHASIESAIHALKNGARDYLVKPFNPDELKHLVKTCLDQRRLLAENDVLREQIQLFRAGQSLSSLIDLERLLPRALDVLLMEMGASRGCGFILKGGGEFTLLALKDTRDDLADQLVRRLRSHFSLGEGLHHLPPATQESLEDLALDPECLWLLPLSDGQTLKGVLLFLDVPREIARDGISQNLRYLSDQAALGFENACRYQDAQELMYTDDLTGLYNHRYMQVAMGHEIRRSQRYGLQFSLVFLDLDHFKNINDQHGHLAGSAALQEVSGLLRLCVRDVDTLFRFGGDEFAAMLVETDGRTAKIVAERIRKTVNDHVFLQEQGLPSRLTATAGVATFPTDAVEKEQLVDLADRAMYSGKGVRNIVCGVDNIPRD